MVRIAGKCKGKSKGQASLAEARGELLGLDSRAELIQALIPLGLEAVNDLVQQEVTALVGERYSRRGGRRGLVRWGRQGGSVYLADQKVVLGFVQTATENEKVCAAFLRSLLDRGLQIEQGLLCVIDGSKGLRKAADTVLGGKVAVQRCQWHKRENVVGYLPTSNQATFRRKLQAAYDRPDYGQAKAALKTVRGELELLNRS